MAEPRESQQELDVAIVGAGVSGVYVGWRLLGARPGERVAIFEQSERVGGRLLSLEMPGIPGVWCELGGMRFTSQQTLVRTLVENVLELRTHTFVVGEPENINYLRGRHIRREAPLCAELGGAGGQARRSARIRRGPADSRRDQDARSAAAQVPRRLRA
jgi:monoamine oxidase